MWIDLDIKDHNCPHCNEVNNRNINFYVYDGESIWEDEDVTCKKCGCEYNIDVTVETTIDIKKKPEKIIPICEVSGLPDVVGDNQIPLFNTPSV
jgi:hypothetical protein